MTSVITSFKFDKNIISETVKKQQEDYSLINHVDENHCYLIEYSVNYKKN